jgi:hypothetical protein
MSIPPPSSPPPSSPPPGFDPDQPQPGWAPPPPQGRHRYGAGPGWTGAPAAGGKRPGSVTGAAVVAIVIGALVGLINLLGIVLAGSVDVEITTVDVLLSLLAVAVGIALVAGGIRVLRGGRPDLLLSAAYATAGVWLLNLVVVLSRGGGFASAGLLLIVGAAGIVGLLRGQAAQHWYAGRTGA